VSKDDKSKHWPAETWQNGDLKRFTKDAVEERGCRPVASIARAPIEKIAELTEVPSTSRDTPYELDGLAKPPKQVQRESSRARQGRQKITPNTPPKRLDKNTPARTISGSGKSGILIAAPTMLPDDFQLKIPLSHGSLSD
jgi:hypothetical protein